MRALAAAAFLAAILSPLPAAAEDDDDDWHFSITPYLYLLSLQGNVAAFPGIPPVNVDVDFDTLSNELEGALMLQGEARKGRWGVLANVDYFAISGTRGLLVGGVVPLEGELDVSSLNGTISGIYRFYDNGRLQLDAVAGARYSSLDLDLDASIGPASFSGSQDKDWWDPIIGMRGRYNFGERTGLTLYGDYGGFGVSSQSVWQVYGGVTYELTDWMTAAVGYRWYAIDYEDGAYALDVEFAGPLIGARFDF
jgi:opacity protein-like surface antigen